MNIGYTLKFLSSMPKNVEDKLLFCLLVLTLSFFVIIRIVLLILFIQTQNGSCSTVVCPDLQKKSLSELPLSIIILETIRPVGATLSLIIFELIFLLINVTRKNANIIAFTGLCLASIKVLTSIIETGSNIHSAKFIDTKLIMSLNNLNATFVLVEAIGLFSTVLAVFYRHKLQVNDGLVKEHSSLRLHTKSIHKSKRSKSSRKSRKSSKSDKSS
uniref:Uncharacterized protein n=1 Tax=Strongyloides stercoralis TaxID=6248 RepID=A0A0K0E7Y2_STRER